MVSHILALALALTGTTTPDAWQGSIKVSRGMPAPVVSLKQESGEEVRLVGELASELRAIASAHVEVVGKKTTEDSVNVDAYRILKILGIEKPTVGFLIAEGEELGVVQVQGDAPVMLNMGARTKQRLKEYQGAKVWLAGIMLPSGQLKVTRYGVLKTIKQDKTNQGDK